MSAAVWFLITALLFYAGALYRFPLLTVLAVACLFTFFLMLFIAVWRRTRLSVDLFSDELVCEKGSEAALPLRLTRKGHVPDGRICLRLVSNSPVTGERRVSRPGSSDRPGNVRFLWKGAHCGLYTLTLARIYVCDPLGLFRLPMRKKARNASLGALVLPSTDGSADPFSLLPETPREPPLQRMADEDGEESLRAYRPGDPARRVHWKVSARRDEIFLRETHSEPRLLFEIRTSGLSGLREASKDLYYAEIARLAAGAHRSGYAVLLIDGEGRDEARYLADNPAGIPGLFRFLYEREGIRSQLF